MMLAIGSLVPAALGKALAKQACPYNTYIHPFYVVKKRLYHGYISVPTLYCYSLFSTTFA
jgi:hypothetical protein